MSTLLIRNGRLIDPARGIDRTGHLLVRDGVIADDDAGDEAGVPTLDAAGCIVSPGLVDLHAELREPGCEEDETIESGTRAALAGGFTSIACIPNTDPPVDTQAGVEYIRQKAARANNCRVHVIGCVSKNREGQELAEIGGLVEAGAVAFSDADRPIHNAELFRRALEYCLMFDVPILDHPEEVALSHDGVIHEGRTSLVLGLTGIPADSEDVATGRDLRMAEATAGRVHLMNISTAGSVDLIRRFKSRGSTVTAEIAPWNFSLTDDALRTFDSNFKVNPPLRSREHVDACITGLQDGTLDVIASCHAPRASEKKRRELDAAPFGACSLETTLSSVITWLIEPGHLGWQEALAKMTCNPARILKLDYGTLEPGRPADITVLDPERRWRVEPHALQSKSQNTPLAGRELRGRVVATIVGGQLRFRLSKNGDESIFPGKVGKLGEAPSPT